MIDKFHKYFFLLISISFFSMSGHVQASEPHCFPSFHDYLSTTYGGNYLEDENIIVSEKKYGNEAFRVVEDITSGTNHSIALIKELSSRACVLLVTGPVVSLEAAGYDKAGFPVKLISTDQAAPGSPANEISYIFDAKRQEYIIVSCRELRYRGEKRYGTPVDCNKMLDY